MSWFRMYVEAMDDPKVMQLDPKVFRAWVVCLCLAKEGNAGDGVVPSASVVAFKLHVTEASAAKYLKELNERGLIDVSGNVSTPHNWSARQYKSDVSTSRVQRFRNRQSTVSRNDNETFQKPPQSTEYRVQSTDIPQTPNAALPLDLDPIPIEGRNGELSVGKVKRERKVFVRPTIEEVEAYCSEHKITNVNPKKFFWKNESNGWVTGRAKTPMKDWKAAIQTWAQNDYDSPQPSMFGGNKPSYQQIEDSWAVPD